jgi:hypothetical protein
MSSSRFRVVVHANLLIRKSEGLSIGIVIWYRMHFKTKKCYLFKVTLFTYLSTHPQIAGLAPQEYFYFDKSKYVKDGGPGSLHLRSKSGMAESGLQVLMSKAN